tara:strand:- start:29767 stop:32151 length:2385 start_codon:yes stop_codon:yes gene_type:complete
MTDKIISRKLGTKAETLESLSALGYSIPKIYYFTVNDWNLTKKEILDKIKQLFNKNIKVAVRSSSLIEDTASSSMAGAFQSFLNIKIEDTSLTDAINKVIKSFDLSIDNQILIQEMVTDVIMSGVVMTKVLDDGSPYYVLNYDDTTGKTDSVTSGNSINKTVYIYNGVSESDFDSNLLLKILKLVQSLEKTFNNIPIDIEFAINKNEKVELLQVRRITTNSLWDDEIHKKVSSRIEHLKLFVQMLMKKRIDIFGKKTTLGIMPDWNPAEMIGVLPGPLAASLYRELITKRTWSRAREKMGYRKMPNVDLMTSLFGRPYIDVRNSINSFLPVGLSSTTSEKIVNAYIDRLDNDPHLHDKLEFEVVITSYDFQIDTTFKSLYKNILTENEESEYKHLLKKLTVKAIRGGQKNSLVNALDEIEHLAILQKKGFEVKQNGILFISDKIKTLVEECKKYGTLPFSVIARHAFIAESLLRSLVKSKAISAERISLFKKSFNTVAGKMANDLYKLKNNKIDKVTFFNNYGHLRPSSYDILSPRYCDRKNIFDGDSTKPLDINDFELTEIEKKSIQKILNQHQFLDIKPEDIFNYSQKSIIGREHAKFIFTFHLSSILELISDWGNHFNLSRDDMSMLSLSDIIDMPYSPLYNEYEDYYRKKIDLNTANHNISSSLRLSYLIRSTKDIHIVPIQRSLPNFIGKDKIEADVVFINPHDNKVPNIENKIVCIDAADPGYDWIFTKKIKGLITKYGGANSHMAIRCAELGIPAAIGCGDQPIDRITKTKYCIIDCRRQELYSEKA